MNEFEQSDDKKIIALIILGLVELFLIWYISQGDLQRQRYIEMLQEQVGSLEIELAKCADELSYTDAVIGELNSTIEAQDDTIEDLIEQQASVLSQHEELLNEIAYLQTVHEYAAIPGRLTRAGGVAWFDGHKETYYNLPMDVVVMYAQQRIAGYADEEMWIREDGCKMLGDYIMVAADQTVHPYASIVMTSLGEGIVVDTGSFTLWNREQIDVATNW